MPLLKEGASPGPKQGARSCEHGTHHQTTAHLVAVRGVTPCVDIGRAGRESEKKPYSSTDPGPGARGMTPNLNRREVMQAHWCAGRASSERRREQTVPGQPGTPHDLLAERSAQPYAVAGRETIRQLRHAGRIKPQLVVDPRRRVRTRHETCCGKDEEQS